MAPPGTARPRATPQAPAWQAYSDGPSTWRVMLSVSMQVALASVIIHKLYQNGIFDTLGNHLFAYNRYASPCGLLPFKEFALLSDAVVTPHATLPGLVHVRGGRIAGVRTGAAGAHRHAVAASFLQAHPGLHSIDYGTAVLGPGLIDVHVHMNEPGREEWEGMATGTRSAAAGGVTTVVDMPLNSHPCTTTPGELKHKIQTAHFANKTHVDVGFWAGLVPENAHHPRTLRALAAGGALGFKAFMSPSGIDDFPRTSPEDIAAALPTLRRLGMPLLVHAEMVDDDLPEEGDPRQFKTWLASRPPRFEQAAVAALLDALRALPPAELPPPPGFKVHVVHVSDVGVVSLLQAARAEGLPVTAETCPHYLQFEAEAVADGDTRFKCAPPIREAANRAALWEALAAGDLDGVSSDHSPSPPDMKEPETGNFMKAWGGIAGLQYVLPATWEGMRQRGMSPQQLHQLWSRFPATLAGLSRRKGALAPGLDADLVVWAPDEAADTSPAALQHRHKGTTPYRDVKLKGKVLATYVRGSLVFSAEAGVAPAACGRTVTSRGGPQRGPPISHGSHAKY